MRISKIDTPIGKGYKQQFKHNTLAYNADGLYPHKAESSNELNSSAVSIKGRLDCHGYLFEEFPYAIDMHPFTDKANSLGRGITFSLYGRLAI